jgi:hypothetical protein
VTRHTTRSQRWRRLLPKALAAISIAVAIPVAGAQAAHANGRVESAPVQANHLHPYILHPYYLHPEHVHLHNVQPAYVHWE